MNSSLSMGIKLELVFDLLMRVFEEEQNQLDHFEKIFNQIKSSASNKKGEMAIENSD
jgi:hypothetical protein